MLPSDFQGFPSATGWNIAATISQDFNMTGKLFCSTYLCNAGSVPIHVDAYLCKCRTDAQSTDTNFRDPASAFALGFNIQNPGSDTTAGGLYYKTPFVTPYENSYFCRYYKIIKRKSFILGSQQQKQANYKNWCKLLKIKTRFDFEYNKVNNPTQYQAKGITLNWLFVVRGMPSAMTSAAGDAGIGFARLCYMQHCLYKVMNTSDLIKDQTQTYNITNGYASAGVPNFPYSSTNTDYKYWNTNWVATQPQPAPVASI